LVSHLGNWQIKLDRSLNDLLCHCKAADHWENQALRRSLACLDNGILFLIEKLRDVLPQNKNQDLFEHRIAIPNPSPSAGRRNQK